MQSKQKENENGRSMIEMLGVLAIIGVLSVGGIVGYSKAIYRYRLNKTLEQITMIGGNIRSYFAPQKSYEGLSYAMLKKAKLVPDEMWDTYGTGNDCLKHLYGSNVYIFKTAKIIDTACRADPVCKYQAFYIRLSDIPEEVCIDLITRDLNDTGVNIIRLSNPGNPFYGGNSPYLIPPLSVDIAVKACAGPEDDADGVESIDFMYDVDVDKGVMTSHIINARRWLY